VVLPAIQLGHRAEVVHSAVDAHPDEPLLLRSLEQIAELSFATAH
jgi:hypothetical protein